MIHTRYGFNVIQHGETLRVEVFRSLANAPELLVVRPLFRVPEALVGSASYDGVRHYLLLLVLRALHGAVVSRHTNI